MKTLYYYFFVLSCTAMTLASCESTIGYLSNSASDITCSVDCEGYEKSERKHYHSFTSGEDISIGLGGIRRQREEDTTDHVIFLNQKSQYGLSAKILDPVVNEYYKISILRKDPTKAACLVVAGKNASSLYIANRDASKTLDNGWEELYTEFEVPPHSGDITVFAWIAKGDSAYFDDLKITKRRRKTYAKHDPIRSLNLFFSDKKVSKFKRAKAVAYAEGVHFSDGNWNKGVFVTSIGPIPIKARFKGDWLDHLIGNKWSFRIKVRKGKTFKRMREFSVQSPESRYFLHEYLSHQLILNEGLLTPRYEFAPLYFNKTSRGVFAIEEHFSKQLLEYNLRREGPILKFDEDPMWRNNALHRGLTKVKGWQTFPNFETSKIVPFGSSQVQKNEKFKSNFLIGHSLLYQFQDRSAPIDELFEIDKLAKYLALLDLHGGKHGAIWHNLRFYFNPISCKLEVINYDNFTDNFGHPDHQFPPAVGLDVNPKGESFKSKHFYNYFLSSKKLREQYLMYLKKYTSEGYINSFYDKVEPKINEYLVLIKTEFPDYSLDRNFLLDNAKTLRAQIVTIEDQHNSGFYDSLKLTDIIENFTQKYFAHMFQYYTNAYYSKNENQGKLRIENYTTAHIRPLRLLNKRSRPLYNFIDVEPIGIFRKEAHTKEFNIPFFEKAVFIEFEEQDSSTTFKVEITPWQKNISKSPYQNLKGSLTSNPLQLFAERNDTLFLKKGTYQLTNKILIAEDKTVIIEAGVTLDLIKNAAIVSHAPLFFKGTKTSPIEFLSSDKSSNGIVVLQANRKSKVEYTRFFNLNTFSLDGWNLSGAVNFYESDVVIKNSTFEGNSCEDALNIIKSDFEVDSCRFLDIFADAFDSDFCTGILKNSLFNHVGNDAIDFSTSQIKIEDCTIQNISDKGISGGEQSTLWVKNCTIDNCNIGAASKDLSEVSLTNVSITNSKYGLVALQKKPEYGPAKIITQQFTMNNCEVELLIEKNSSVNLNGRVVKGVKEKIAEMFY